LRNSLLPGRSSPRGIEFLFNRNRLNVAISRAQIPHDMPSDPSGIQRKHNWLGALNQVTGGRVEVNHGTFRSQYTPLLHLVRRVGDAGAGRIPIHWDLIRDREARDRPQLTIHEEKQTDVMLAAAFLPSPIQTMQFTRDI
jgi:hypothetical protein